jgi:NitT/TauT family transport system substrate-binding protein
MPYGGRSVAGLVHYLALEDGYYARHGVEVSSSAMSSGNLVPPVLTGEAALATSAMEAVLSAAAGGAPLVIVGSQLGGMAFSVMAQPAIRTPQDLRGKRLGVASFTSPSYTAARLYLRAVGLDPGTDVAVTRIGGVPEIHGALQSGGLDSATIPPPLSYALAHEGLSELADLSTLELKYHQSVLFTTRAWLQEHPDVARRILAGYAEAQRAVLTDQEAALRVLAKWVGTSDPEALERTYALALRGFTAGPTVDSEAVQTVIELLAENQPNVGALRPTDVVDNTLVNEAALRYGFPTR